MTQYNQPSETAQAFIDAVNIRMQRDGVSKSELARRSGVSLRYIAAFLNGKGGSCRFEIADAISEALGTSTIALLKAGQRQKSAAV